MFKVLQENIFSNNKQESARCGEIYYHGPTDFTIHCELCELKSTEYEIFILHFKLMHSDNIMLQTKEIDDESTSYVDTIVKVDVDNVEQNINNHSQKKEFLAMEFEEESCIPSIVETNEINKVQEFKDVIEDNVPELKTKITLKKQLKCGYCGKTYRNSNNLKSHIALEHELSNAVSTLIPVKCRECSEQFSNQQMLNSHSIKTHNGIKCSYCHRKFKCKANFIRHTEEIHTHSNNAKFVCDFENCSKRFYTNHHLNYHKRATHGQPKNYVCDVCGFNCRAMSTLRKHSQIHTDERPYSCNMCSAKFKSKNQLETHSDIHNRGDERSFLCDFENCTKTFFSGRSLADHIRRHKMPKKYVCDICGYSSKQNQSLQIHYRKHTGEVANGIS